MRLASSLLAPGVHSADSGATGGVRGSCDVVRGSMSEPEPARPRPRRAHTQPHDSEPYTAAPAHTSHHTIRNTCFSIDPRLTDTLASAGHMPRPIAVAICLAASVMAEFDACARPSAIWIGFDQVCRVSLLLNLLPSRLTTFHLSDRATGAPLATPSPTPAETSSWVAPRESPSRIRPRN